MIKAQGLRCGYDKTEVLRGLDLHLDSAELAVLIGPNGAGKSTLLFALLGFLKAWAGKVSLYGKDLNAYGRLELAKQIAFVPQESFFQFDYRVYDVVMMGRYPYLGMMQSWSQADHQMVEKVLASLNLGELSQRYYSELSGGEKQRVLIARALAQDTRYIFLDESLSQLDINHQIDIMQLLRSINQSQGKGILIISHNLNLAANYADRMIFIKSGRILGQGSPQEMMQEHLLQDLFGTRLSTHINPESKVPNIVYPGK